MNENYTCQPSGAAQGRLRSPADEAEKSVGCSRMGRRQDGQREKLGPKAMPVSVSNAAGPKVQRTGDAMVRRGESLRRERRVRAEKRHGGQPSSNLAGCGSGHRVKLIPKAFLFPLKEGREFVSQCLDRTAFQQMGLFACFGVDTTYLHLESQSPKQTSKQRGLPPCSLSPCAPARREPRLEAPLMISTAQTPQPHPQLPPASFPSDCCRHPHGDSFLSFP